MSLLQLLQRTTFADQAECLARAMESVGLHIGNYENAPGRCGHVCGVDIFQVVAAMNLAKDGLERDIALGVDRPLAQVIGLSEAQQEALAEIGVVTAGDALNAGVDGLVEATGIGQTTAQKIIDAVSGG